MSVFYDVYAAILVGGIGSRLGTVDKAQLRLTGAAETLFDRLCRILAPLVTEILVVGRSEQAHLYSGGSGRFVADQEPGVGPLAGLQAALRSGLADWCFLVACDMPELDASVVELLAQHRQPNRVVVPRTSRGLEPTCALYPRTYLAHVDAALAQGSRAIYKLLLQTPMVAVDLSEEQATKLRNINTDEDLR